VPDDLNPTEGDGLGDWRLQAVTTITRDVPPAYVGGPSHKAGTRLHLTTMVATDEHKNLGFPTPSATALAMDAAFRSAGDAAGFLQRVNFQPVLTPEGPGETVPIADAGPLFDFFSASMAGAWAAFQAIEAFANEMIALHVKGTVAIKRRKGFENMNAEQVERAVSTEEKVGDLAPKLLGVQSIKGTAVWEDFLLLKGVRDSATHFKSGDQIPLGGKINDDALYHLLLNNELDHFPRSALRVISKITPPGYTSRWLTNMAARYGIS
jgi:hypothetical protein